MFKKYSVLILNGVIFLFILYVSMRITSTIQKKALRICGLILLHYLGKYLGLVFHVIIGLFICREKTEYERNDERKL